MFRGGRRLFTANAAPASASNKLIRRNEVRIRRRWWQGYRKKREDSDKSTSLIYRERENKMRGDRLGGFEETFQEISYQNVNPPTNLSDFLLSSLLPLRSLFPLPSATRKARKEASSLPRSSPFFRFCFPKSHPCSSTDSHRENGIVTFNKTIRRNFQHRNRPIFLRSNDWKPVFGRWLRDRASTLAKRFKSESNGVNARGSLYAKERTVERLI